MMWSLYRLTLVVQKGVWSWVGNVDKETDDVIGLRQ